MALGETMAYDQKNITEDSNIHRQHMSSKTHHEITMHDIKESFKEDFPDEIHDANKYCDMASAAEMEGHEHLAKGLYEMAHDEYTHASFIHDTLIDLGCEISEKDMMMWHELKERIHRKFRR